MSLRELRHNKSAFALSMLTVLLATAMLTAILELGNSLRSTLAKDARNILGGDYEIRLTSRDFTNDEIDWLKSNSAHISKMVTARAAGFTDEHTSLLILRVVENNYPLSGQIILTSGEAYSSALLSQPADEAIPSVVASDLAGALQLSLGDTFQLGQGTLRVVEIIDRIPDPRTTMLLNAPVVLIATEHFDATGLNLPGTLKTNRIKVDIGDQDAAVWRENLNSAFPDNGWRVRGINRVVPGLQDVIGRMETLLLLVSLGTLLIAGICVGNTVSTFLRTRINSIAMLRSLGMPAGTIRIAYWQVTMIFVIAGIAAGMPIGMFCQWLIVDFLSSQLPFKVDFAFSVLNLTLVLLIMLVSAWIFTIRPLHTFSNASPISLFSLSGGDALVEEKLPRSGWYEMVITNCVLIALLLLASADRIFLLYFTAGGIAALLLFRLLAHGVLLIVNKIKLRRRTINIGLRLVARNSVQVSTAAVSLGIGLSALLTFALTEANFNNQLTKTLNTETPAYYFAGMQPADEQNIRTAAGEWFADDSDFLAIPTLRAKITHFNKVSVDEIDAPEDIDWIIRGDRYITWTDDQVNKWTGASKVSEGEPWGTENNWQLVSFDAEAAEGFGLEIGDKVDVLINGQSFELTVANLRAIDWSTFDVNFAMVLSDGPWDEIPHGYLGSVRKIQGDHFQFQRQVVNIAPSVTPIRTETIVESATGLLRKVGILLNIITLTAIVSGIMVLAVAIAEGRHRRAHDSVVLRLLGTSQSVLSNLFNIEFLVIAVLTVLPGLLVAVIASYSVTSLILHLAWATDWTTAAAIVSSTLLIVLGLGYLSTRQLITNPPLNMLRNE